MLKGRSEGQSMYVNGSAKGGSGAMGNYTVYVNPYLVLKSGSYTKHFYIEGQRIVSKLGDGLGDATKTRKAGSDQVNYQAKYEGAIEGIVRNLKFLGQDGAILTAGKSGKVPPGQILGNGNGGGGNNGGGKDNEAFQYYFHPDHLGSTSYITDASGEVYQHLEYFAFGETFVEEHSNTDRTPYLYNGKELDEETGLYYYGARYYDPRTSVWLAVDPLTEKYAGLSAYNYCFNNPIAYNDPDGRDGVLTIDGENATVTVTVNYSKEELAKYNEALNAGADYTEDDFRQDFQDYYETKNGTYEIDGENYNVKFEIKFNSYENAADMPDDNAIPEGEMNMKFDANAGGAGDFGSNIITLKAAPRYLPGSGSTGGSFSHEVLHGLGVGHSDNETGGLSSYAGKRELKPFEVSKSLTPAIQYARKNKITQGKILITRYRQDENKNELARLPSKQLQ